MVNHYRFPTSQSQEQPERVESCPVGAEEAGRDRAEWTDVDQASSLENIVRAENVLRQVLLQRAQRDACKSDRGAREVASPRVFYRQSSPLDADERGQSRGDVEILVVQFARREEAISEDQLSIAVLRDSGGQNAAEEEALVHAGEGTEEARVPEEEDRTRPLGQPRMRFRRHSRPFKGTVQDQRLVHRAS